ncbi:MAG: tRNA (N6-threonylcarbamoyladenosine(37)-N6)-methyltransferase TrmO [Lachnospiraceae bacterium]|nr:tRNA (N6-threonylcarbamoyladenosine(37)-N6)-methyltransferase TrmO [bacterium]MDY5517942.1 tRNA (N6-threonylcarbamoyladenosine(37)-N6)-methyltransferase TrmO [Lachnospiraceae bacterium]
MKSEIKIIAHIRTDFPTKFGIPRQSSLADELTGEIIFEPEYRQPEAFRGIEEFSHLWLLWEFSEAKREHWSATVKPPRLGGKVRMGVFATRSPFRPNPIGLSCVRLVELRFDETYGPVLVVAGVDLMDKTPIYDVKPYLPYVDAHPEAIGGFGDRVKAHELEVLFLDELRERLPEEKRAGAIAFLKQDPRPAVHKDPARVYKIAYAGYDIHFTVEAERLTVVDVVKL